jgi:erythromycin esterase-like protein
MKHLLWTLCFSAAASGCFTSSDPSATVDDTPAPPAAAALAPEQASDLRSATIALTGTAKDYDALLASIGNARVVLIGEATHGTHEFYRERVKITQRLVAERGFDAVIAEADWPDAARVDDYVHGRGSDPNAPAALGSFQRFPTWMWRNEDVAAFAEWLKQHNASGGDTASFYGFDLYSMKRSATAVLEHLTRFAPEAAEPARQRYACVLRSGGTDDDYGPSASDTCAKAVGQQLESLRSGAERRRQSGATAEQEFSAERNARVVINAENYYREMYSGSESTWNMRDRHMAEVVDAVVRHRSREGQPARVVVWAHNSHVGDARATEMGRGGELNVGQLVREKYAGDAFNVGFSTYTGYVTAASNWDEPGQRRKVVPALPGSYEHLLHETRSGDFMLLLRGAKNVRALLQPQRLERAIGVVYRPETERQSHYFDADLPSQFDAVIHFDETTAVRELGTKK